MIHPRILYETSDQIAYPLKMLFESSFHNRCLPSEWKYALQPYTTRSPASAGIANRPLVFLGRHLILFSKSRFMNNS